MNKKRIYFLFLFSFCSTILTAQKSNEPKGNLFIIGGGKRSSELTEAMLSAAKLTQKDYIVLLPMSTEQPDSAYFYFKQSVEEVCANTIANLNFTKEKVKNKLWLDSLENAKLIYIAGGDQTRFMQIVLHTPVYDAIHKAFANGATIAGTSAGAAVMSQFMITGKELIGDTAYNATLKKLRDKNLELQEGLGLITSVIIDQHFIVRSRYNRLLSALAKFPNYSCVGIDEATAIIVRGKEATVAGDSQVIVLKSPKGLSITGNGLIKFDDVQMSIYTAGDTFSIN